MYITKYFRNLRKSEPDSISDEELNRLLRLLLKSNSGASEKLRYIGSGYGSRRRTSSAKTEGQTVGYYYGPYGYYGSPWWAGYGRWGYYAKPGTQSYSYGL